MARTTRLNSARPGFLTGAITEPLFGADDSRSRLPGFTSSKVAANQAIRGHGASGRRAARRARLVSGPPLYGSGCQSGYEPVQV